jgi:hypothetical protein
MCTVAFFGSPSCGFGCAADQANALRADSRQQIISALPKLACLVAMGNKAIRTHFAALITE